MVLPSVALFYMFSRYSHTSYASLLGLVTIQLTALGRSWLTLAIYPSENVTRSDDEMTAERDPRAPMEGKNQHARRLFDGIAGRYELPAQLLSFGQYGRWRRSLVSRLEAGPDARVLDLCTGTAGVAIEAARRDGPRFVGVDVSSGMLSRAQSRVREEGLSDRIDLLEARAESLPFADDSFDVVCFTFLFRYVEDPTATLKEVVRVLKPGGRLASLEFCVPPNKAARVLWYAYTRTAMPLAMGLLSPGWREVGKFLGPSISRFYRKHPLREIRRMWLEAGISGVGMQLLSLGGAQIMWGSKGGPGTGILPGTLLKDTRSRP